MQNAGMIGSSASFILTNDIDMSNVDNWTAIGTESRKFAGTFNGNGYTISNLGITSSAANTGLFGYTNNATIQNVNLTNVSVTSSQTNTGGLVGAAQAGSITNCHGSGDVQGASTTGLLAGLATSGVTITSCSTSGSVSGSTYVGGMLGRITGNATKVTDSISNTSVTFFVTKNPAFVPDHRLLPCSPPLRPPATI